MKNIIIVTGGAGFVGSNLIQFLLKKTKKFLIISLDNYSTGKKRNHIKSSRVRYIRGNTISIRRYLSKYKKKSILFFILESLQEYIKVSKTLMNVLSQIRLDRKKFLNFA